MRDIAMKRIMTAPPVTIGPDESAATAMKLLESHGIHHLPVVEDGVLIGMLATSDFLKLHILRERPRALEAIPVRRIMEADPVTLDVSADLIEVATKLGDGCFHALPVVEPGKVLVGIVTSTDLINHLLMQIPRGDGSLREPPRFEAKHRLSDTAMADALRLARETPDHGEFGKLAVAVLHLREENLQLHAVYQAAELYLRSGLSEREHSVLSQRLLDVQRYRR